MIHLLFHLASVLQASAGTFLCTFDLVTFYRFYFQRVDRQTTVFHSIFANFVACR